MKSILIPLCLSFFIGLPLLADDAPLAMLPGGNVKPISNNDIQLYNETIDIYLLPEGYSVEVNYWFKNLGKQQNVMMGFPSNKNTQVKDYKVYENGKALPTQSKPGFWEFKLQHVGAQFIENPINSFECFEVIFKEDEIKHIKDVFRQDYTDSYEGDHSSLFYILKTGGLWKDKIHSVIVRLHTEDAPKVFKSNGEFNGKQVSLVNFIQEFKDIEPEEDLFFVLPHKNDFFVTEASSELLPKSAYGCKNVKDENAATAWVEGTEGYGLGEYIQFYTNMSHNVGVPHLIDSIGIINGYTKTPLTFQNNSRVKKLFIKFSVDNDYEPEYNKPIVKPLVLLDIDKLQIIRFKEPIKATDIEFKIAEVYPGLKYKDTAISEIIFFVRQE